MSTKETKTEGKYNIDFSWVLFVPIMLLLGIVPLITRLEIVELDIAAQAAFGSNQMFDFFSQNKAAYIMMITAVILFMVFLAFDKKKVKLDNVLKGYYILTAIYFLMSVVSTMLSEYKQVAMWGIADRAEGMIIIAAYLVMMIYAIYVVNKGNDMKYILFPLIFLIVVTTVIGFFQYIGKDLLLSTDFGKKLIVPEVYAPLRDQLSSMYESGRIYGTMYHYNYIGSYAAMMIPLFLVLTIFTTGWKKRSIFAIMTLMSTFLLLGSTSRAGLIGLGLSLVMIIVVFARKLISQWKIVLPVILVAIMMVVGLNVATKGAIFERIPTLINDAVALFIPSNSDFDYKEHIPVTDIKVEGNTLLIQTQQDTLKVEVAQDQIVFKDQLDQEVAFELQGNKYVTTDQRFSALTFRPDKGGEENKRELLLVYYNNKGVVVVETGLSSGIRLVNSTTLEEMAIEYPPTIGFRGKERLGSARGYIWSRSLPMMKDTMFIGYGPDTYPLEFPQNDLFGKWYAYETPNMLVDKAHNLYLQIGINQGGIALLAFLGMMALYIVDSLKLYAFKRSYSMTQIAGVGIFASMVGYLGAGIFNDSIVSVAPIFWILLGCGIAINYIIRKESKALERIMKASKEHATIDITSKKHI